MLLKILAIATAIAGTLMSLGHFPQAWKIFERKSAKDVSLVTYGTFAVGSWIWLAYGVALGDVPIIVSFAVGVIGTMLVLILALRYR